MAREKEKYYNKSSLLDHLLENGSLADGRSCRGIRHTFGRILLVMTVGYLVGETSYRGIARLFASERMQQMLNSLVEFPFGTPSYSTLSRAMQAADPVILCTMMADFFYQMTEHDPDAPEHICIDGKAVRAAMNRVLTGKSLYIVNIFNAGAHLFLSQIRVGPKKQEGKVIEQEIANILCGLPCTVTMDAMGTKKAILDLICQNNCNAVLPLKGNNPKLTDAIRQLITACTQEGSSEMEHFVDLNDADPDLPPGRCVVDPQVNVYTEDNPKEGDCKEESPAESFEFFDNVYGYTHVEMADGEIRIPEMDPGNKDRILVKIGDRWILLVKSHGRYERREFDLLTDDLLLARKMLGSAYDGWDSIQRVGMVTRYRAQWVRDPQTKQQVLKVSITRTPYLLTEKLSVEEFARTVRRHWQIEIGHDVLDQLFMEDHCTARKGAAPENCSLFRKVAYNLLSILISMRESTEQPSCEKSKEGFLAMMDTLRNDLHLLQDLLKKRIRSPFKN